MRLALLFVLAACAANTAKLAAGGWDQSLRARPPGSPPASPQGAPILILELDGIGRDLLYDMLRAGELPHLEELLGGDALAHAYLDDHLLSTLPSTTLAAWVSALTGVTPAEHGVTGNEFFIRERRVLACPSPVSFSDTNATLSIYTDHYVDRLTDAPTVYERMREREPNIQIWIATDHLFRGADRLLLVNGSALAKAFLAFLQETVAKLLDRDATPMAFLRVDRLAIEAVATHLANDPLPDVVTLYIAGTDDYAHVAEEGPDAARRTYMRLLDKDLARLVTALRKRGRLDREWVVVLADHGHTAVLHDSHHAITGENGAPPAVLREAGFRVRPFKRTVSARDPFSAVLAYGGPIAYVYLADRSRCPGPDAPCAWDAPPRYEQDVLPAADAFYRANRDGRMKDMLDMILVRRPRPWPEVDLPFEVYIGDGKTQPLADYLAAHPHPTYVDFVERMHDLAVGRHGERAGDILLLAHDGDVDRIEQRYYFAAHEFRSWHGSPSRRDSEVPLIVATRGRNAASIGRWVRPRLGDRPYLERITDLLLGLRSGALAD